MNNNPLFEWMNKHIIPRKFEKIRLVFTNPNTGMTKSNYLNVKLNGEWLVTGIQFNWGGQAITQTLSLVKRELTVEDF